VPDLTDLIADLSNQLAADAIEMDRDSDYYEAEYRLQSVGIAVPPKMRFLTAAIGWPRMYLDSIEERLDIEGFRLGSSPDAVEEIQEWWQANDLDEESGLAHLEAMIHGRSYITVAHPGPDDEYQDIPVIRVESSRNMIADIDPRTREVTSALRLYKADGRPDEDKATLYLPDATYFFGKRSAEWVLEGSVEHGLGVVPVVPLLNRERLSDRNGRSEITPELRSFTDAASRIMMDMQAAAELMAVPQRILFGVDPEQIAPNGSQAEVFSAYMAQIFAVSDVEGKAMQFQSAELMNFVNVLEELAKHVASYTGLPPQYLSFSSENPASAEAIRSSESRLVKKCERKARMFGGSWERVMRLGYRVMGIEPPEDIRRLETIWRDPSTPTFAAKADAVSKLYANGTGIIPKERARVDLGYSTEEREQMKAWDDEDAMSAAVALAASFAERTAGGPPEPEQSDPGEEQVA